MGLSYEVDDESAFETLTGFVYLNVLRTMPIGLQRLICHLFTED